MAVDWKDFPTPSDERWEWVSDWVVLSVLGLMVSGLVAMCLWVIYAVAKLGGAG